MLKTAGATGPSHKAGSILSVLAKQHLFAQNRLVVVGTLAASTFPQFMGMSLSSGILMTQNIDLTVVSLAALSKANMKPLQILSILHQADASLLPITTDGLPHKFRGSDGMEVEFLSAPRRGGKTRIDIPNLGLSAEVRPYMEYLLEDPLPAAILHGSGVLVRVPQPARFAIHKLIVAQKRPAGDLKRHKDLAQAREIMRAMELTAPDEIADALEDARSRGTKWREPIEASLREIVSGVR